MSCLSESNKSILMWSHYAENHTGFCFEYDLANSLPESDLVQFYPINYTEEVLNPSEMFSKGQDVFGICILASIAKHVDWSYENEWRFFDFNSFGSNRMQVQNPTAIYFGVKCDPENEIIRQVIQLAVQRRINTYKMFQSPDKFELIVRAIKIH